MRKRHILSGLALAACLVAGGSGRGQAPSSAAVVPAFSTQKADAKAEVTPVGCASCGGGLLGAPPTIGDPAPGGCGAGGCGAGGCGAGGCGPEQCSAGRFGCDCFATPSGPLGATFMGIYQCICCKDPCYEPRWIPLANSAFFMDNVRPVTQMRLGIDGGWDLRHPDKSELFWAAANRKGPRFNGVVPPGGKAPGPGSVNYGRAYMVNEAAVNGVFSISLQTAILTQDGGGGGYGSASGFGDIVIGTKSMVLDCELLQVAFGFKTYLPSGNFTRGLGTGHVSFEPSLLAALKLTPHSYLQGQLGYLFPISGDSAFQGSYVYGGLSYNHLLWNCGQDIQVIGNIEGNLSCANNGLYTDPATGFGLPSTGLGAFFNAGPGVRLVLCKKVDIGVGTSFAFTRESFMGNVVRAEFRWRF